MDVVADLTSSFVKLALLNPLKNAVGLNGGQTLPTFDIGGLLGSIGSIIGGSRGGAGGSTVDPGMLTGTRRPLPIW
jgi:hypothetical protein